MAKSTDKGAWRKLVGALGDADWPSDMAERHDAYLTEAEWEEHQAGTLRGQGGVPEPEDEMDDETRAWLDAPIDAPLEPYDWEDGEELEGEPLTYIPGRGWISGEDEERAP